MPDDAATGRPVIGPMEMKRLIVLLDELLELPDDAARERWLADRPSEQQSLLPALRRMLAAHQAAAPTPDAGPTLFARLADSAPASSLHPGGRVGRYRLLRELGQGGMSEVWLARADDDPQAEAVALKLPAVSLARERFLERLARERRILQRLEHPHIARLLDAGIDDTGQQYLVLAYVEGQALTTYCDAQRLTVDARVDLLLQVLDAVGFAHAQQVLHRDLKPSNILVTPAGRAMLLDFGIAKLLVDGEAQETELTERWGRAMTPAYASPEQRLGTGVTVRSDLYAVGVMLYELLSGRRPPPADERHDALPPPSQALQPDSTVVRAEGGAQRLARRLARDFDDVVMQALELDPARRPADAATLSRLLSAARQGWPARGWTQRLRGSLRRLLARQAAPLAACTTAGLLLAVPAQVHDVVGQVEAWLRPAAPAAQRVVLVTIGPDEHRRLFGGRRPLDPTALQRLVQRVLEGQPQRVAVDIDTSQPAFAALPAALGPAALQQLVWARDLDAADDGAPRPRPVLGTAEQPPAVQAALAVLPADRDGGRLRWYVQAVDTVQGRLPTLGAALAGRRDGSPRLRAIPFAATERLEVPASAVLAEGFDWAGRIRGRLVVVGGRYDPGDEHATPLGLHSGIDVLAQVAEAEAAGGGYRRPDIGLRLLAAAAAVVLTVAAVDRLGRWRGAATAATLGALGTLAWGMVDASAPWPYLLLPVLCVALAALPGPRPRV